MPDILHRISIDASPKRVHDLIASTDGIARWWTGRPLTGEHTIGSSFSVYFGDAEQPAAVMQVLTDTPDHVVWRVIDGPDLPFFHRTDTTRPVSKGVKADVRCDSIQPRPQRRTAVEPVQTAPGTDHRVLDRVLSVEGRA